MDYTKLPLQRAFLYSKVCLNLLKYPLLFLATFLLITHYGQGVWVEVFKALVSIAFSGIMVWLIGRELWNNKHRLELVWWVYFRSGLLTYVRAILILTCTLFTAGVIGTISPDFMRTGWANWLFGYSTNVTFQPLIAIQQADEVAASTGLIQFDVGTILTIGFWLLMILAVPFLAEIEEKIFRQGVHTWKAMVKRSIAFGLAHLIMGIPLFMGVTLCVPGFLFACRYKYGYHRHLKKFNDELTAQEAGVRASTADHAVYNAILLTSLTAMLLLL
ncbi:MAG TPA: hypothetical protein V6C64_03120 [Microcoleaceae cyanobacterium]